MGVVLDDARLPDRATSCGWSRDATGIAPKWGKPAGFEYETYGSFVGPHIPAGSGHLEGLAHRVRERAQARARRSGSATTTRRTRTTSIIMQEEGRVAQATSRLHVRMIGVARGASMVRMVAAACPRCATVVALHEGRPRVERGRRDRAVAPRCWDARDVPVAPSAAYAVIAPPPARSQRIARGVLGAVIASSIVSIGVAQWSWAEIAPPPPASAAVVEVAAAEPAAVPRRDRARRAGRAAAGGGRDRARGEAPGARRRRRAARRGVPDRCTTGSHPVTDSAELDADAAGAAVRRSRASRSSTPRPECGQGHCGIDLDGPRGPADRRGGRAAWSCASSATSSGSTA